jgi:putative drug exporter of the RND superfamily
MTPVARWCYRHRFVVLSTWTLALIVLLIAGSAAKTSYNSSFVVPGTGSAKAIGLLQKLLPTASGDQDTVVWHVSQGTVQDAGVRQRMDATLARIGKIPEVASVTSPYAPGGSGQVSKNGTTAYALVNFTMQANDLSAADVDKVISTAQSADSGSLSVQLTGEAIDTANAPKLSNTVIAAIVAAAIVLFLAFGSLLAMLLPLVTAIIGLGCGLMAVGLLSHALSVASLAPSLAVLVGLGVGIDYALFIVTRYRGRLLQGDAPEEATARALSTAGRAVLIAAATVCIALLGMLVLGMPYLNGVAIAAAIVVLVMVASAETLLPALFGILRLRVLSRRQRRRLEHQGAEPAEEAEEAGRFWLRWAGLVQGRPAVLGALSVAILVVLAIPVGALNIGHADDGTLPPSTTSRQAYDMLTSAFGPGFNGPLQVVADVRTPADTAAYARLTAAVRGTPDVASVTAASVTSAPGVGVIQVYPASAPDAKATTALLTDLRSQVIPAAQAGTSMQVYVGGTTAVYADFSSLMRSKLPWFIAAIVGLGFVLLLLAFRSLAVPAMSAVMNLLGAAASFGITIAIFQWGWGLQAIGLGAAAPIDSFLPVLMIAVLFGLSMDYQVFLISRIHEEWARTGDNRQAVRAGQARTGRVITAAAAVMACVFLAFALGGQRVIAEFGVSLICAVVLDALIIRSILVPAWMQLNGRANWWLPGWLDRRLPRLTVEPPHGPPAPRELSAAHHAE